MTKVIGIVQVKGGAGRSTLATNLAGELSKKGKTLLVDCDMPQGTSASWAAVRQSNPKAKGNLSIETAESHKELVRQMEGSDFDYVILDSPPRIAEMTRAILILSDICIVPVGASTAEIWATTDILKLVDEASKIRPVDARMIWTRYRPNTKLAQELTGLAVTELTIPPMHTRIHMRVAYMEALGEGLTAAETGDQNAKQEINSLVNETLAILRKKK